MTGVRKFWLDITAAGALAGCVRDHTAPQLDAESQQNEWMIVSQQQDMTRAAVVRQATLYPHHFVTGRAELNDLGHRDAGYLAEHLAGHGGQINVRRGDAAEPLYAARVETTAAALADRGVPTDRLVIDDGLTGGDGLGAERALRVLEQDAQPLETATGTRGFSATPVR